MNTIFKVFGLTGVGIKPKSFVSVADVLSTQPLTGYCNIFSVMFRKDLLLHSITGYFPSCVLPVVSNSILWFVEPGNRFS